MKRIIYLLLLLPPVWACDKYSYEEKDDRLRGIDFSELHFADDGGTRTLTVADGPGTLTATSSEVWCAVSVSGNKITVVAERNPDQPGRSSTLRIARGDKHTTVGVIQGGNYFALESYKMAVGFNAGRYSVGVDSDFPVTAGSSATWITNVAVVDNVLSFDVTRNMDIAATRTGRVEVVMNGYTRTLDITQEEGKLFYEDFLGTYTMRYSTAVATPPNRDKSATVKLVEAEAGKTYYLEGLLSPADEESGNIVVTYDEAVGLQFYSHVMLKRSNGADGYWAIWNGSNVALTTNTTGLRSTDISLSSGTLTFSLVDNGRWGSLTGVAMIFYNANPNGWGAAGVNGDNRFAHITFEMQ
jgi:hypothetical protein